MWPLPYTTVWFLLQNLSLNIFKGPLTYLTLELRHVTLNLACRQGHVTVAPLMISVSCLAPEFVMELHRAGRKSLARVGERKLAGLSVFGLANCNKQTLCFHVAFGT